MPSRRLDFDRSGVDRSGKKPPAICPWRSPPQSASARKPSRRSRTMVCTRGGIMRKARREASSSRKSKFMERFPSALWLRLSGLCLRLRLSLLRLFLRLSGDRLQRLLLRGPSRYRPERGDGAAGELLHHFRKSLRTPTPVLCRRCVFLPGAGRTRAGFSDTLIAAA